MRAQVPATAGRQPPHTHTVGSPTCGVSHRSRDHDDHTGGRVRTLRPLTSQAHDRHASGEGLRTRAGSEAPPPPSAPDPRAPPPLAPTGSPSCPRARAPGGGRPRRHSRPSAAHAGASWAPRSTGRRPGALPRRLVTRTHTPSRSARTGRPPRVPEGTGRPCLGRRVLRCSGDQNGRCSPGLSDAAPITACYTAHSTHTLTQHPGRTAASFLPLPRPEEEVLENENSVEGREPRRKAERSEAEPPPAAHAPVFAVFGKLPRVLHRVGSGTCRGRGGEEEEVKRFQLVQVLVTAAAQTRDGEKKSPVFNFFLSFSGDFGVGG